MNQFGQALEIKQVPMPETLEPGALIVKTTACSICGTDVHLSRGNLALKVDLPVILGHEMVGRVRVPDNVDDAVASLCSCAFRSVMNAFDNLGAIEPSEHVVIQGAGPLGILAAAVARVQGARSVTVIGAPAKRLELAKEFGATHVLDIDSTTHEERLAMVRQMTDGRGPDVVLEFTGFPGAFNEGLDLVRRGGRYLTVGQLSAGTTTFSPSTIVKKNIRVIGSFSGDVKSYWKALQFASAHMARIPFRKMITGQYALADVNLALERMHRLEEIKPLILMDP